MVDLNLSINTDLAREILTGFIRSEITRVGMSRAVIGLSGGIDSALSCALAVEALGAENVLAVRMPYKASSQDSLDHAQLLIDQLGNQSKTIEITDMVEPLFKLDPNISRMRMGNIMASTAFWRETRRERQDRLKEAINELFASVFRMRKNLDDVIREERLQEPSQ